MANAQADSYFIITDATASSQIVRRRWIARSVVCPPPKKSRLTHKRCEGRRRHIVGRLEVAHLLHGGRRRGQAEVLGNKVGIHVDPRGDLCDHVGSVEPLERLAAVEPFPSPRSLEGLSRCRRYRA